MNQERPHFIKNSENLVLLGQGKRAHTYGLQEHVIKVVREVDKVHKAATISNRLKEQYQLFREHLGSFVVDTQFVIGSTTNRDIGIFIFQPRIEGIFLGDAVARASSDGRSLKNIIHFLDRVVTMFYNTGQIADLAGRTSSQFYNPLLSKNVLVDREDNPVLVDTNFSHSSERFGLVHNKLIANGVERTIRNLRVRENENQ